MLPIHAGGSVASGLFPQETGKALVVTSSQHARIVLLDDRKLVLRDIYDVDGTVSRCTAEGIVNLTCIKKVVESSSFVSFTNLTSISLLSLSPCNRSCRRFRCRRQGYETIGFVHTQ